MGWFEDAMNAYSKERILEYERSHRLHIENDDDITTELSEVTSVSIFSRYKGRKPIEVLGEALDNYPKISRISVYCDGITWDDVCSLNLSNIEELILSLKGVPGTAKLAAPVLKKLVLYSNIEVTPLELLITPTPEIDFSGMPQIECLELVNFQQINPDDFKHNSNLKRLVITKANLSDVSWLKDAEYSLSQLILDCEIENCNDIIYQRNLEMLCLYHSLFKDVKPIMKLQNLEYLEVRYGAEIDEKPLRESNIKKVIITRRDHEIDRIRMEVHRLIDSAVHQMIWEDKHINHLDELPEFSKKRIIRSFDLSMEEKMQNLISIEYRKELYRIKERTYKVYNTITVDEEIEIFMRLAKAYCPFLEENGLKNA